MVTWCILSGMTMALKTSSIFFVLDEAQGLTQVGLSLLNQGIEAYIHGMLGAQVNLRSSILGDSSRAKEAQRVLGADGRHHKTAGPV